MNVISVNTGLPREVMWRGRKIATAIYKQPVTGRVALRKMNLEGDRQADLSVHGGEQKAVYCYPHEHYAFWRESCLAASCLWAVLGKTSPRMGCSKMRSAWAILSVGSANVVVTQPRLPCYKLGVRFQSDDMVKRFLASGRTGFYLAVTHEGEVGAGDEIGWLDRDPNAVPVSEITRLYIVKRYGDDDLAMAHRALRVSALPESWKEYFRMRLGKVHE